MRDKTKSKEYFDEYIEKQIKNYKEFKELLDDDRVLEERLQLLKEMIFDYKSEIVIARYSRGDSIDEIVSDYNELLVFWKATCNMESIQGAYEQSLWYLSIGILLGEKESLKEIRKTLEKNKINDWLFNFLLYFNGNNIDQIRGELLGHKKYQSLKKAICTLDRKQLIHYLDKEWYPGFKDFGWYDSHKNTKRGHNLYFGYWCFEAGAIVKLLKWNDSDFKEQQYYPYDLVHYKE